MKNSFIYFALISFLSCIPERKDTGLEPSIKYEFDDLTYNENILLASDRSASVPFGSKGSFYSIKNRETSAAFETLSSLKLSDLNITAPGAQMVLKSADLNNVTIEFIPSKVPFVSVTANEIYYFNPSTWKSTAIITSVGDNFLFRTKDGKYIGAIEILNLVNVDSKTINIQTQNASIRIKTVKF